MQSVKVERLKLIDIVKKNREEHRDVFLKAQGNFRTAVVERLDAMLADARAGKKVSQYIGLEAPQDHTRDYDRVLTMLDLSVDDTITLNASEFEQYVMDRWQWARQFGATASLYRVSNKYAAAADEEE